MMTWLLFIPAATLFMVINVIIGCYVAIRLGYGPPDWKAALNLVVRLTTLQDRLNAGRDWLDVKAPWANKVLDRLHVPRPIIIVDVPEEEEEETEKTDETSGLDDEIGEFSGENNAIDEAPVEQNVDFSENSVAALPDGHGQNRSEFE